MIECGSLQLSLKPLEEQCDNHRIDSATGFDHGIGGITWM